MSFPRVRVGLQLAAVLTLSACGGGSGSPGAPDNDDPTALSLGVGNYQSVGQTAAVSALYLGGAGSLAGGTRGGPLLRQVQSADKPQPAAVVGPIEVACGQGGSLAVVFNDTNGSGDMEAGETLAIEANACKEDGVTTQGRVDLSMQAVTGVYGSNSFNATLGMKLTGFGIGQGGNSLQGDGELTFKLSRTPAGVGELGLSAPRMALTGRLGGQAQSYTLGDMQLQLRDETVNGSARATLTYAGTLTNTADGRQVRVSTPQPLVMQGDDAYPSAGQVLVRGRAGSALRITPVSAAQVRFELDADGDGNFETSTLKNWAELL